MDQLKVIYPNLQTYFQVRNAVLTDSENLRVIFAIKGSISDSPPDPQPDSVLV